jgi:hypothetical protein
MNNTTSNNKVSLEEITETYKGTTEYSAYGKLGQKRREITGILGVDKKANAFLIGSWIAKPFSVLGSAFGFATILTGVAHQELFNSVWWFLFVLGLGVGVFFEYLSTANEDSFVGFKLNSLTKTGIIIIIFIKSYAVFMHYQTSDQLSKSLTANITSDTIEETPKIKLLKSQIATLKQDIEDKKAEKTEKLIANSTSAYKAKREDALNQIAKIENSLKILKDKKESKELQLTELTERNIVDTKQDIKDSSNGLIWSFFALLVIFELGGTLLSVLYKKTIISGVDETVAVTEEVKSRLYTKKAGLEETTNRLNAFRVADNIKANHNSIKMIELESKVKEDEIILLEQARMAEMKVANKELELKAKLAELEELKHSKVIEAIEKEIRQIKTISGSFVVNSSECINDKTQRRVGFVTSLNDEDYITALYANGIIKEGDKLTPKSKVINPNSRREDEKIRAIYNKLLESDVIEYKPSQGYYARADYETALRAINGGA